MAVTSGFFDSRNGDRKYNTAQMSEYFRGIVSGGVFQHLDGGLQVTAGTGLSVNVAAGRAIVQNRWIQNSASLPLSISAASETYGRKDAVVLRLDSSARTVSIVVKTGTPAASPAAPSMTRSGGVYEMALAYVNIAAGATSVTVTDKRSDSAVCGWAAVAQAASGEVDQMLNDMKTGFDGVEYDSPVEMVQGCDQLLQNQIDEISDFIFPENLIDFIGNTSELSGLNIMDISKTTLKIKRNDGSSPMAYYIPISVASGKYSMKFVFTSEDGTNLNLQLYDTDKTTKLVGTMTSNQTYEVTFASAKTVYLRIYLLTYQKVLDITYSAFAKSDVFEIYLNSKVGYNQLNSEMKELFYKLVDTFNASSKISPYSGEVDTKSGNAITVTTNNTSAYITWSAKCEDNRKYIMYYDVEGTYSGGNYSIDVRLSDSGFTPIGVIQTISQTSGASASGTILIAPTTGQGGYLCFNLSNKSGQTIEGDIYLYDVTGMTDSQIASIDFSQVGASAIILLPSSGSASGNTWSTKKVVFYGDSITQTSYPEKVQAKLGFTLVKNAIGGTRFGYAADQNSYSDDSRIATVPTDADVVCIMGGTNDWQHTEIETGALTYNDGFDRTKFKGAVAYTIQKMQARCPSAKIYLLTNIGGRGDADPTVPQPLPAVAPSGVGVGNTPLAIRNATIEVANELNIPVIDTWACGINGFNRAVNIADTVHPTNAGQILIAEYIVNALVNDAPW